MRILFLSRADAFDGTSSMVVIPTQKFSDMLEDDPTLFVQWVVPRNTKDADWKRHVLDRVVDPSRIVKIPIQAEVAGRTIGYFMNEDLWRTLNQARTEYAYDVVLTNQLPLTPIFTVLLRNRYSASRYDVPVPMVNWHMWTATFRQLEEVPEYYGGEEDVIAESLASLYCLNVWESSYLYASHLETMGRWCNERALRRIEEQSITINQGVDLTRYDDAIRRRAERIAAGGKPRLFWGGRLANQKKPRVTFPIMEGIRLATGCEVVVSTSSDEAKAAWVREAYPDWTVHAGVDTHRFAELTAEGDVFLCNSVSEGYGVGWLEMLAVGMAGVFKDEWWNRQLLPDWYPYRVSSEAEQGLLATALIKSWPSGAPWTSAAQQVRNWLEASHHSRRTSTDLLAALNGSHERSLVASSRSGSMAKLALQAARAAAEEATPVPLERVFAQMTKLGKGREFGKRGDMISRMYIRRLLQANGWTDLGRSVAVELRPPR